jgi:hypothetical protein
LVTCLRSLVCPETARQHWLLRYLCLGLRMVHGRQDALRGSSSDTVGMVIRSRGSIAAKVVSRSLVHRYGFPVENERRNYAARSTYPRDATVHPGVSALRQRLPFYRRRTTAWKWVGSTQNRSITGRCWTAPRCAIRPRTSCCTTPTCTHTRAAPAPPGRTRARRWETCGSAWTPVGGARKSAERWR